MSKYSAAFTIGALLLKESEVIIPFLLQEDEEAIQKEKETGILMGINSQISRRKKIGEIRKRFKAINKEIWEYFIAANQAEKAIILYYACLKTYQLIQDFHIEVVLAKWRRYDLKLVKTDFLTFLYQQFDKHPEIDKWSDLTHDKIARVTLLMLKEIKLLEKGKLQSILLPDTFWHFFLRFGEIWFLEALFLPSEKIKELASTLTE